VKYGIVLRVKYEYIYDMFNVVYNYDHMFVYVWINKYTISKTHNIVGTIGRPFLLCLPEENTAGMLT